MDNKFGPTYNASKYGYEYADYFKEPTLQKTSEMMMLEDISHNQKLLHFRLDQVDKMYKKICDLYDVVMLALVKNIEAQHEKEI